LLALVKLRYCRILRKWLTRRRSYHHLQLIQKLSTGLKNKLKVENLVKLKRLVSQTKSCENQNKSPGVGKYKWNKEAEIRGYSKDRTIKSSYFDEIALISKNTPGPKYKLNYNKFMNRNPNYSFTKLRSSKVKGKPPGPFVRDVNGSFISTNVAPGFYKTEIAFSKTQVIHKNKYVFTKNKEKRYFDKIVENKKFVPGVGAYEKLEEGYKHTTRPVTAKLKAFGGR
jgi:acyl-CoA-binding protein